MLGPELETHKGNKIVMAIVIIVGLGAAALVYAAFATLEEDTLSIAIKTFTLAFLALMVYFYIWRKDDKRTTGWSLRHVPNAFVLLGLLNSIFKPDT